VVSIGGESLEFCGGTHVHRAGDIGLFKLLSETGVAQGVRRIEAVTGIGALEHVRAVEYELSMIAARFKIQPLETASRIDKLLADSKALEKQIEQLKGRIASGGGGRDLMSEVTIVNGVPVLAVAVEVDDPKVLRDTADQLRDKLGAGVLIIAGTHGGSTDVKLIAMVTRDLVGKLNAGKILSVVAQAIGGKGGGKPDMAQGGGKDAAALPAAFELAKQWVADNC
jgi:alanyl-tRNA synthetase